MRDSAADTRQASMKARLDHSLTIQGILKSVGCVPRSQPTPATATQTRSFQEKIAQVIPKVQEAFDRLLRQVRQNPEVIPSDHWDRAWPERFVVVSGIVDTITGEVYVSVEHMPAERGALSSFKMLQASIRTRPSDT